MRRNARRRQGGAGHRPGRGGFTLVEVVVVLVVLALGTALVAPSLFVPEAESPTTIPAVVAHAQAVAARRGETLRLELLPGGPWEIVAEASSESETLASGRLVDLDPEHVISLRIGPLGSCGASRAADARSAALVADPLRCDVVLP